MDHGQHGSVIDATDTMYPSLSKLVNLKKDDPAIKAATAKHSTYYIVVLSGTVEVLLDDGPDRIDTMLLGERAFVSSSGQATISPVEDSMVYIIERFGYRGTRQAGLIEKNGRLSYIDGCSDTILVYPPRLGDSVLNYLHFPKGILQTQHLHPSIRLGLVLSGGGVAWGPGWEIELSPGTIFKLNEQEIHSFKTPYQSMDIVAFHPDSDTGPSDVNHPMLNRTFINHGQ